MKKHVSTLLLVLAFLLAGCGEINDAAASGGASDQKPTTESGASQASTTAPAETGKAIDLLYIQDSLGFGVAELYGEHIAAELGIAVDVQDKAIGNLSAVTVLTRISGQSPDDWSALVRDAEVIVFFANPYDSGTTNDFGTCVSGSPAEREPPVHYSPEDWQPYRDVLDEVYQEIWEQRAGEPVVLRAVDFINPAISAWRIAGIEPECTAAQEAFNQTIQEAAEANGATVVSLYDLFNGPGHDEDPREKGWIGPDGIHMNTEGMAAIAAALAAAGLEPAAAP